jgi:hypothetical protein
VTHARHTRSLVGKSQGDSLPNSPPRTGDNRHFTFKPHTVFEERK